MSAGLAWVGAGMWWVGLLLYGFGQIGFSGANIFYDSMIVGVSKSEDLDIVSGYGYALGYVGGGLLFLINVLIVTKPQLFGIADARTALSISFVSVAVWWAVFTIPLLAIVKGTTEKKSLGVIESVRDGVQQIKVTFHEIKKLKAVLLFLIGYWLYIDGVGTIYKMAVFFASRVLELSQDSLITALLLTQFVAFPAALFFGWLGKRIGAKAGILIGLVVYIMVIIYAWAWLDSGSDFYKLAVTIGLVQGGVQSLSRSLFARLVPRSKATEFFGFFNMVGKFASILGPLLMAAVPMVFVSSGDRDSILVLILLFTVGAGFLLKVNVANGVEAAKNMESKIINRNE